jgi:hypothetical protein
VEEAHALFVANRQGEVCGVSPDLEKIVPDLFGICFVGTQGNIYHVGDWELDFFILIVSKPFVFAPAAEQTERKRFGRKWVSAAQDCNLVYIRVKRLTCQAIPSSVSATVQKGISCRSKRGQLARG